MQTASRAERRLREKCKSIQLKQQEQHAAATATSTATTTTATTIARAMPRRMPPGTTATRGTATAA